MNAEVPHSTIDNNPASMLNRTLDAGGMFGLTQDAAGLAVDAVGISGLAAIWTTTT